MSEKEATKIPVFKHWKGWYLLVLAVLVIQLIIYYFISHIFA
jgi:hypothetical protein